MTPETRFCKTCKLPLVRRLKENSYWWKKRTHCGYSCAKKGQKGLVGIKRSDDFKRKISLSLKKMGHKPPIMFRDKNPAWKGGLAFRKKEDRRGDSAYREWRRLVWLRDGWKCKINNTDCGGRFVAHHILSWRDYPELRYEMNNGITLCHNHHPRKRKEEARLSTYFQELVK